VSAIAPESPWPTDAGWSSEIAWNSREGAGALGAEMEAEQLDQAVGQLSYEAAAKLKEGRS